MQTRTGIFAFLEPGCFQDATRIKSDCIQFLISDVSDTYFFDKHSNGKLERRLITTQGKIIEEFGEGYLNLGTTLWKNLATSLRIPRRQYY